MQKLIDATKLYLPIGVMITAIAIVFVAGGVYNSICFKIETLEVQAKETSTILKDVPTRAEWNDLKISVEKYREENQKSFATIMQYLQKNSSLK